MQAGEPRYADDPAKFDGGVLVERDEEFVRPGLCPTGSTNFPNRVAGLIAAGNGAAGRSRITAAGSALAREFRGSRLFRERMTRAELVNAEAEMLAA